jgi:sulfite reductase beta subunit
MAFVSSGYNPDKPMENRISDIGPKKYDEFYPPVIAKNKGKWLYHDVIKPGVMWPSPATKYGRYVAVGRDS